jgi:hypothetical protein
VTKYNGGTFGGISLIHLQQNQGETVGYGLNVSPHSAPEPIETGF